MTFQEVSSNIDFAKEEEKILKFWQDNKIFEKSLAARPKDNPYTFYDGPPFATGLPHYGHLLAGIIKDIIPRYWTMKGFYVERRFGWDCHGLPIEYEIDKTLGINGRAGVEKFGVANYNAECKKIVLRFTAEWEKTVNRIGRWVDFEHDYKTMDANFMESVWWVVKQLWEKNLVYRGYRVMPYSTAVATPLSNFEASSNYKEVQDPALTVAFQLKDDAQTSFLAWTTTPWTLPSNLALSVGPEIKYVNIRVKKDGKQYILGESRLGAYFKKADEYEVLNHYVGKDFDGWRYEPLFDYFADRQAVGAFKVLVGEHVTDSDGTGIVHTAPAFGEDDYNICQKYGIELVMPIDDDGKFTSAVPDFAGLHVKEADKKIIEALKNNHRLFRHDTINHNYPFCWRSDTPLIYRAVSSWFVKVEAIKERLMQNNKDTSWVPENLRDGRFGNWLENARDWNISRNRYWGNPLPIWHNKVTDEFICMGSIKELEGLTGKKVTDLHREYLDELVIPAKDGKGEFRRVSEVLDCWFESGAMPYAQNHYPFENKEKFEKGFPADFIAEGLDQTRGWFYTLCILGTALFDKMPFKNVVVNGMILAEDGKKMSKRLKNYPDPVQVIDTYGADALRLYMIQSPAVRAEELRFAEAGVKDIVRRILLKWWHSYSFFVSYAVIDGWAPSGGTTPPLRSDGNILDNWIMSRLQSLLANTEREMAQYHLYNVVPELLDFIEDLTNVYIRLNRKRFWGEGETPDKSAAYQTLYTVLFTMTKVMAPFTPFLAETMYANLGSIGVGDVDTGTACRAPTSVHLEDYPLSNTDLIRKDLEESVSLMNRVVLVARNIREQKNIKIKIPLKRLTIIHRDQTVLTHLKSLEHYLSDELNVRVIEYKTSEADFVELTAKANGAVLGKRVGKKFAAINKAVATLDTAQLIKLELGGEIVLEEEKITKDDVAIYRKAKAGHENVVSDAFITVEMDITLEQDQINEGIAREVVNRIQKLRKSAGLKLSDRIHVQYVTESEIAAAINQNPDYVKEQTLSLKLDAVDVISFKDQEACDVDGKKIVVGLEVSAAPSMK